jgi:hypothetical protein
MSSIETLEKYAGTRHEAEAAALVLMHAADHVYAKQAWEPGEDKAVDLMDDIRQEMGFCELGDRIPPE